MGPKKGYKQSEEHKNKISQSLIKAHAEGRHTGGFKKGNNLPRFSGKQHTEEWKLDRSKKMKQNNPMKSQETVDAVMKTKKERNSRGSASGEKNGNWKGGRPKYRGADWHKQRRLAMERDQYTCQLCGIKQEEIDRELTVHHILPYHDGGTNDLDNLLTVCMSCHFTLEPRKERTRCVNERERKIDNDTL